MTPEITILSCTVTESWLQIAGRLVHPCCSSSRSNINRKSDLTGPRKHGVTPVLGYSLYVPDVADPVVIRERPKQMPTRLLGSSDQCLHLCMILPGTSPALTGPRGKFFDHRADLDHITLIWGNYLSSGPSTEPYWWEELYVMTKCRSDHLC